MSTHLSTSVEPYKYNDLTEQGNPPHTHTTSFQVIVTNSRQPCSFLPRYDSLTKSNASKTVVWRSTHIHTHPPPLEGSFTRWVFISAPEGRVASLRLSLFRHVTAHSLRWRLLAIAVAASAVQLCTPAWHSTHQRHESGRAGGIEGQDKGTSPLSTQPGLRSHSALYWILQSAHFCELCIYERYQPVIITRRSQLAWGRVIVTVGKTIPLTSSQQYLWYFGMPRASPHTLLLRSFIQYACTTALRALLYAGRSNWRALS